MTETAAFDTLVTLADVGKKYAKGLPAQIDIKAHWSGIGFSLFGKNYVAPMGEVSEMLETLHYTQLPGVTPWIRGVANVRGRLLPLSDLAAFLGGELRSNWAQQRILVIDTEEVYGGLIVDAVYGMQHFPVDNYSQTVSEGADSESMVPFLQGAFMSEAGEAWTVFSPWSVVRSEGFFQSALVS